MWRHIFLFLVLLTLVGLPEVAASATGENPVHDEIRSLRDGMLAAWDAKDIDSLLGHLDEDVVVTWQNAELCRGRAAVRKFYDRMMVGDDRVVQDVQSELEVETLSILHGEDTAIAYGTMKDHWILMDGLDMNLESRWSATLVREDGRWRIAAYHTSTNLFDNPLLEAAAGGVVKAGVAAGLLGLCAGAGIVWLRRRS